MRLYNYQRKGIDDIRALLRAGTRRIAYVLSTGGGKTFIFCHIARRMARNGKKIKIVLHRKKLVMQTSISLAELGVPHQIMATKKVIRLIDVEQRTKYGKSFIKDQSNVIVASVKTLVKKEELLKDTDLLIIDEGHHGAVGDWRKCIDITDHAVILGVTATLIRLDGKSLGDIYDAYVEGPPMMELIKMKKLCMPRVFASQEQIDTTALKVTRAGDYKTDDIGNLMDKSYLIGNTVKHYKQLCDKVPAIAYCCNINHARHVANDFKASGYNAYCLTSKESEVEQLDILNKLAAGEIHVVTSVEIISEGTDVPLVGCAISLRPTESLGLWDQQFGRCLRRYPDSPVMEQDHMRKLIGEDGTHYAFILDHAGNAARHGLPTMGRQWSLEPGFYKKSKKKGPVVRIATCPECLSIHEAGSDCPNCGYEYPVEAQKLIMHKDGKLIELAPDWGGGLHLQEDSLRALLKKAKTLDQLQAIADARGYKPGWVTMQVRLRSEAARKYKRSARL